MEGTNAEPIITKVWKDAQGNHIIARSDQPFHRKFVFEIENEELETVDIEKEPLDLRELDKQLAIAFGWTDIYYGYPGNHTGAANWCGTPQGMTESRPIPYYSSDPADMLLVLPSGVVWDINYDPAEKTCKAFVSLLNGWHYGKTPMEAIARARLAFEHA